ncbi:hypothetical protein T06_4306 [Trichinella sp. T6]|nr:hypothetical protein T06_4306 [Trichinella sp. T6]
MLEFDLIHPVCFACQLLEYGHSKITIALANIEKIFRYT